jgi:hypothetical protein
MAFYSQLKSKLGNILVKVAALSVCINLKMDDTPIGSFQIAHSPLTLSNLSPLILVPLIMYPLPPLFETSSLFSPTLENHDLRAAHK